MNTPTLYIAAADLIARIDIVAFISEVAKLSRKGNKYWGLCPFHKEKTPSFSVMPDEKRYYCYGCHAKGNVIQFVMDFYHLTFKEARDWLAQRYGIDTRMTPKTWAEVKQATRETQEVNEFAKELIKALNDRINKLIYTEQFMFVVLKYIKTELDLERPLVIKTIKAQPILSHFIDKIFSARNLFEKLEFVAEAERWVSWP